MASLVAVGALGFSPTLGGHASVVAQRNPIVQMKGSGFGTGVRDSDGMSEALPFLKRAPGLGPPGTLAGDIGFDPLQITDLVPIQWSREAELKHARVCMLAWAGWVAVDCGFRVPFAPEVTSLYAHDAAIEKGPFIGMLIPIALVEVLCGIPKCFQLLNDPDAAPGGDYTFDPLGIGGGRELEEKELANGRAAILGFSGTVTQAALTGNTFPYTYNGLADIIPPLQGDAPLPAICGSGLVNGCQ